LQHACELVPGGASSRDVGASDVFYSTCYLGQPATPPLPASVGENFGPVQVMNFAVPQSSTQKSIDLAAAYYVFGSVGKRYPLPPWTDPTQLQIRNANSGTQAFDRSRHRSSPGAVVRRQPQHERERGSRAVAAGQSGSQETVDSALGILASDYLLQNAQVIAGLAVQDRTAHAATTRSTAFARDNAKHARWPLPPLGAVALLRAESIPATNLPLKPGVSRFIDGLNGSDPLPGLDRRRVRLEGARSGKSARCTWTRANDGGDYSPFKAP